MEEFTLSQARSWIKVAAANIAENAELLAGLDTAIGDGDHGINMSRGFSAVEKKLDSTPTPDLAALFKLVGMALLSSVGGASGPLYGGFFLELAKQTAGKKQLDRNSLAAVLEGGLADIRRRGKAEPGDKTIVDALLPAVEALKSTSDDNLAAALQKAAQAGKTGAESTISLRARKGRASYLGGRSIGHQDPGAASCSLLLDSLAAVCPLQAPACE
jgi:phosphoenolpyruvate---glycerone phosphotransferase subunit DhaL